MSRAALTQQQIAALSAGAAVPGAAAAAPAAAAAAPAAPGAAAETTTPAAPAASSAAPAAPAAPAAAPVTDQSAVVAYLQGQVETAQAAHVAGQVELAALKSKLAGLEATQGPLLKIAAQSVSNMRVALGMSAVDLSTMSATALLAEHASTEATFQKMFPVGGVAASSADEKTSSTSTVNAAEWKARVAATQF